MVNKLEKMRQQNAFDLDAEKENYRNLLQKYTDLDQQHKQMKSTLEAKDQECLTLQSHNQI